MQSSASSTPTILALNIRSGGGERTGAISQFLDHANADVVVLTEWRASKTGELFVAWAKSRGMSHAVLNDGKTHNGVFVASKFPFDWETRTPKGETAGVLMLVRFASWAMLASYFPQAHAKRDFFNTLVNLAVEHAVRPFLIVGDLNTGNQMSDKSSGGGNYHCADQFDQLSGSASLVDLWRGSHGPEAREWTWLSRTKNGFRIDHAFGNRSFVELAGPECRYDHAPRLNGLSDHSALFVTTQREF
jgi:exodeoxyribonuclease III